MVPELAESAGREGSKGQAATHGRSPEEPTTSQWGWVPEGPNTGGLVEGLSKEPLDTTTDLVLPSWQKARFLLSAEVGPERPLTPRHS